VRIRVIDAFTDRPFAGNPAGVCLLDGDDWPYPGWPDEQWMRDVAAELALAETAFARPVGDQGDQDDRADGDQADWALRWFTPAVEVDLCGHATLATAYAMHTDRGGPGTVRFASRSGVLITHSHADGTVTLDFPAAALEPAGLDDRLAAALGAAPAAAYRTGALGDLLLVLPDEAAVARLAPDITALAEVGGELGVRGVIATAAAADPAAGYDFVSRFFVPTVGVAEDPVTGSAHTALAPYWSARLGRDRLTGRQTSRRGGTAHTAVRGERVELTGAAVTVWDGRLHHRPPSPAGPTSPAPAA